jgi:hypothetical protein
MLTTDAILEKLGYGAEEQIYFEYTGISAQPKKYYKNPFTASNDKTFKIYVNNKGRLVFKDFSASRNEYYGDCFTAAMFATGLSFNDTLKDIDAKFKLGLAENIKYVPVIRNTEPYKPLDSNLHAEINYTVRPMQQYDKTYWNEYYIFPDIVELYNVKSCTASSLNGNLWLTGCQHLPLFVYEYPEGCKLYSPKNKRIKKWLCNVNKNTIDSINTLPDKIDKLIITSSKKDGLVLATHGYWQVSFLSESVIPDNLPLLLTKCNEVYCLYDNDHAGKEGTAKLCDLYPMIKPVYWGANEKDISDYSKMHKFNKTKELLNSLLGSPSFYWEIINQKYIRNEFNKSI